MSVNTVDYLANLTPSTQRGPSESIWGAPGTPNGWIADFIQDFSLGTFFEDDFNPAPNYPGGSYTGGFGRWTIFSTANGVITDAGIVGGGITLAASTTADQGLTLSSSAGAFQIITSGGVYQSRMAFEARVATSTASLAASTADMFVGLMDNGTGTSQIPITTVNGVLSTTPNLIGFHKRGGVTTPGDWGFVYQLAGGTAVYPTNLQSLVTTVTAVAPVGGTYYKLGFVYDNFAQPFQISTASTGQTAGIIARSLIRVYVNGVSAVAFLTSTNVGGTAFPTGIMGPVVAFMQQSTTASVNSSIDWLRVAQNANA